jgi:hypothetical protein
MIKLKSAAIVTAFAVCTSVVGLACAAGPMGTTLQQAESDGLGLKPQSRSTDGIQAPEGLNYSLEANTLLLPIAPRSDWGVGLNLNLNAPPAVEAAPPSALGLQPKRTPTPSLLLQRRF